MTTRLIFIPLAAAALLLGACETVRDFNTMRKDRNNAPGDTWLSDQMESAQITVSGTYRVPGWGQAFLDQQGRNVRGYVGDYPVRGVVSGTKAYLLRMESGWYRYSMILEMPRPGVLVGYWSRAIPFRREFRREVQMVALP
ncbi:MAG: hypothetical protein N2322_00905 [Terrimicrobiaceae bacterium]|nr:hypothetical protein [Terrimicrobiaceae bacterium]